MRLLPLTEPCAMRRIELGDLAGRITNALADLTPEFESCTNARINLRNIRRLLAQKHPGPMRISYALSLEDLTCAGGRIIAGCAALS
ncbi:hypothetical protein J6524_09740 [Bradyrhizobium sp. WSM 1738]|uniref:hypothetical protein n=1 Tax=Bradyrhizobium hereditatis TaxID=2821405 RepID=UPI001CE38BD8|nr:hypothetical protein [Bradyrhizobium hereditatis]MCA6115181.1 hypothetical protein [Bradyrhizobium hereditatis]